MEGLTHSKRDLAVNWAGKFLNIPCQPFSFLEPCKNDIKIREPSSDILDTLNILDIITRRPGYPRHPIRFSPSVPKHRTTRSPSHCYSSYFSPSVVTNHHHLLTPSKSPTSVLLLRAIHLPCLLSPHRRREHVCAALDLSFLTSIPSPLRRVHLPR